MKPIRKSSGSAATSLARVVTGQGEQVETMALRTATISAVNKTAVPWTATINLSGVLIPGVTMLGWYDPQVGDRVQVIKQGPVLLIMGTLAPGKLHTTTVGAPPARPTTETAPAAPAEIQTREVSVQPSLSSTYVGSGVWDDSILAQGGASVLQRAFYFYGNQIATVRGAGKILSGTILLRREDDGAGQDVSNVWLGRHNYASKPATAAAAVGTTLLGQLGRREGKAFDLPASIITALNTGTNHGFSLNPSEIGLKSFDYMRLVPFGADSEWSGSLSLTIRG